MDTTAAAWSQLAAWTMNRSLPMVSSVMAFQGRTTNSDSTLPRAWRLDGAMIGCNQHLHFAVWMCCGISRHEIKPLCFVPHAYHPPPPSLTPTQLTIAVTNYTHALTVTNSSAFHMQLQRFKDHPQASVVTSPFNVPMTGSRVIRPSVPWRVRASSAQVSHDGFERHPPKCPMTGSSVIRPSVPWRVRASSAQVSHDGFERHPPKCPMTGSSVIRPSVRWRVRASSAQVSHTFG